MQIQPEFQQYRDLYFDLFRYKFSVQVTQFQVQINMLILIRKLTIKFR